MSSSSLGDCFDIHGGGLDLIFPHHESILLVSEAHTRMPVCNHFIHNSFVTLGKKKMSKSTGNFVTVRELSDKYGGKGIRFYVLKHHYRAILDFDESDVEKAAEEVNELERKVQFLKELGGESGAPSADVSQRLEEARSKLNEAMDDDLHADGALSSLMELVEWAYEQRDRLSTEDAEHVLEVVSEYDEVLGIF